MISIINPLNEMKHTLVWELLTLKQFTQVAKLISGKINWEKL